MMQSTPRNEPVETPNVAARALRFGENLIRYAAEWIDDRRYVSEHRRYIEELATSGELDGLLEAVGLRREQLDSFSISPLASAELLAGVMQRVGLASADVDRAGTLREDVNLRCRACENWRQCRRWLKGKLPEQAYREFCPNASALDELNARCRHVGD